MKENKKNNLIIKNMNNIKKECRLKFFPVSIFSIVFGLLGLTIVFEKLEKIWKSNESFSETLLLISTSTLVIFFLTYLAKIIFHFDEVKKEFNHPVKLAFFPALSVSFLLSSISFLEFRPDIAKILLWIGATLQLIFTIKIISLWINHPKFKLDHLNPAWFIPILGNVLVPISAMYFGYTEISLFFFSIGFWFWIIVMTLFFNRIIFHGQMAERFVPTLFILISPPFIAFIAWSKISGGVDVFGKILYFFGLFLFMILLSQAREFLKIRFYLSSWAYSFPIASMTIATILMYRGTKIENYKYLAYVFTIFLFILIVILGQKTFKAIRKKEICVEEDH